MAVPLEASSKVVAVLALYRAQADDFSTHDLEAMLVLAPKLALAIEHTSVIKAAAQAAGAH